MSTETPGNQPRSFHYGWIIVVVGAFVTFSSLGIGRFTYGMLLPAMEESLSLSYSQMGLISTANFIGYMGSVLISNYLAAKFGARSVIAIGLAIIGGTMIAISTADHFEFILALYLITGVGSGIANVPMMGLVSHWFARRMRGRAGGSMVSANGGAIVLSGILVPIFNVAFLDGWRVSWWFMGAIVLVASLTAALLLRNRPEDKGLRPMGEDGPKAEITAGTTAFADDARSHRGVIVHLGFIYLLFGATYTVFVTFIVTTLVADFGYGEGAAGTFWAWVGGLSVMSGPMFGWLSDHMGRKFAISLAYALFTLTYAFVALGPPGPFLIAAISIFGLTVWSIPSIMTAACGDYMGPVEAVRGFGIITLFFGGGQVIGPQPQDSWLTLPAPLPPDTGCVRA